MSILHFVLICQPLSVPSRHFKTTKQSRRHVYTIRITINIAKVRERHHLTKYGTPHGLQRALVPTVLLYGNNSGVTQAFSKMFIYRQYNATSCPCISYDFINTFREIRAFLWRRKTLIPNKIV